MLIKYNCRYFKGSTPCKYHKTDQRLTCDKCLRYGVKLKKILIIKLLAIGDVLRTTFILDSIKKKFKDSYIIWVTDADVVPLLINNELIDEVLEYNLDTISRLLVERFDIVFNPSNDRESAVLARLAKGEKKFGFIYNEDGYIEPLCEMARYYLQMGINDNLKRMNKLTYQEILAAILGVKYTHSKPMLRLTDEELIFSQSFKERHKLSGNLVVGLNTGAGERWQLKKLSISKTVELAERLNKELKAKVILFGGPRESERNSRILKKTAGILIDAGCANSLREFASLINAVDVLVSADTLGLHIAVALNKYVVAIFGPTSHSEVELYDRGQKVYSRGLDCVGCYKNNCSLTPSCMDDIDIDEILAAIRKFLYPSLDNDKTNIFKKRKEMPSFTKTVEVMG